MPSYRVRETICWQTENKMIERTCPECGVILGLRDAVCLRCGPPRGVSAWSVDEKGNVVYVFDPLLLNVRWPGVSVSSTTFNSLPLDQQLFSRAMAFVGAAGAMCERVGEAPEERDWPSASVCYYLLHLATELFLKACLQRRGVCATGTHSISRLLKRYREILPDRKYNVPIRWLFRPEEVGEVLRTEVKGVDRTPDQLFRYGVDNAGAGSGRTHVFHPGIFLNSVQDLSKRWQAIWSLVPSSPPPPVPPNTYQPSPRQERRSSPSGRRPKPKRRKSKHDR